MKKYIEINNENIEFKNLLSGPAQVGRILNYIIYSYLKTSLGFNLLARSEG